MTCTLLERVQINPAHTPPTDNILLLNKCIPYFCDRIADISYALLGPLVHIADGI